MKLTGVLLPLDKTVWPCLLVAVLVGACLDFSSAGRTDAGSGRTDAGPKGCDASDGHCDASGDCSNPQGHDCDTEPLACVDQGATDGRWTCECPTGFLGDGRGAEGCMPLPSDIQVSFGTLAPAYAPDVTVYGVDVGIWQPSVEVRVTIAAGPSVTLNGAPLQAGQATLVPLNLGENAVKVEVSQGAVSRAYTITITRRKPVERYLKASKAAANHNFGSSVSLSEDGHTLAVGVTGDDKGTVYVFTRTDGTWIEQAQLKAGNPNAAYFGGAVALSGDGDTLAVGAPFEDSDTGLPADRMDVGAAYVFRRTGGSWSEPARLKAFNPVPNGEFGLSLSLNGGGTILAVGAVGSILADPLPGAVYVFAHVGNTWSQPEVLKSSNTRAGDHFGRAVSLSGDGTILAVGGHEGDGSSPGAVYVFTPMGSGWREQTDLKASNAKADDKRFFGSSVSVSGDGSTLAVGSFAEGQSSSGVAYVFTHDGRDWSQQAYLEPTIPGVSDYFGTSVSLSGDGATLVVANNGNSSAGPIYVFTRTSSRWSEQVTLKGFNTERFDGFGESVSLSRDGTTLAVGALSEDSSSAGGDSTPNEDALNAGAVYVFQ